MSSSPWDLADPGSGDYEIRAVELDSEEDEVEDSGDTVNITIDNSAPSISSESPSGVTSNDNPNIEASFSDSGSGLQNASISFEGVTSEGTGSDAESLTIDSADYESLSDGTHSVDYEAFDDAGNQLSGSWSFTVDTVSPDPDTFSLDPSEGLYDVDFGDDFGVEIVVEPSQDHESGIEAVCYVNGNEEDSDGTNSFSAGSEETFNCDIPSGYMDETVDFDVVLEDEAGNSWNSDIYFYELDASAPTIDAFEPLLNISVFNEDFDMEYLASDNVAGVDVVEYYLNTDPGRGDGSEFAGESGEFTVDTSDLDEGSNEIFLRGRDNLDKWGNTESFEFTFLPDELPELGLEAEDFIEVTSGEEVELEVDITNTGRILVPAGEIAGSESFVESADYGEMAPGNAETVGVVFSPDNGLGNNSVTLETSTAGAAIEVTVLVRADENQQENIDGEVDQYNVDFDDLTSRIEELRGSLSDERASRINSDYEEFESQLNEAEQAVEEGRYYEADEILQGLDSSRQSAEATFEEVKEEHETAMRNRYIMAGLFFVLLLVGGGTGFVLYSEDYDLDIESLKNMDVGFSGGDEDDGYSHSEDEDAKSVTDKIRERIDSLRGNGEEAPDYEFK